MAISFYTKRKDDHALIQQALKERGDVHFFESADEAPHPETEIISVFTDVPVTRDIIESLPKLRLIAVRATGVDHIDLEAAKEKGVAVAHVSGYGSVTVAEYTILLLLMTARRMQSVLSESCKYDPNRLLECGIDLAGKTIAVIGTGAIGMGVAGIAKGIGMTILGYDAYPNKEKAAQVGMQYIEDLDELLEKSDVISLHVPLLDETRGLINEQRIAKMKDSAILLNTARGELIETKALVAALSAGKFYGVGLDVVEAGADQDELRSFDNVIVSNHNAYNTVEAIERINQKTIENIHSFLEGKEFDKVA